MLKLISMLVILLEVVQTRRSDRGTITPEYFDSGRTIIYSIRQFRENNNGVVFPIPFHTFMPLANLLLFRLQGQFPTLRTRSCPDLYSITRPPKRPLALGRGTILIPEFVRYPPSVTVYDVVHSLPRGRVGRVFPFTEDETRRHFSYHSGTFIESEVRIENIIRRYFLSCSLNGSDFSKS